MRRRQVLALAAVGLTGCLSDSSPGDATENGTTDDATGTPRTTTGPTNTSERPEATEPTDPPATDDTAPPNLESYPGDCPTYDASRVVCTAAAPDGVPLRMAASQSSVELPADVEFTLHNDTDAEYQFNHFAGRLHKRVDGEWFHVAPNGWPEPLMVMPGGESYTWSVSLAHSEDPGGTGGGADEVTVGGLGGGRYAFGNVGWFSNDDHEGQTATVATVDIDAPPAELTTTGDVNDASVDGETLSARWTGGHDGEYSSEATFVLTRVDENADHRLITEQVLQPNVHPRPLRDALALSTEYGVESVRLTGTTGSTPPFGVRSTGRFEYDGRSYEMSAEENE
ncbi:immunoglobulin-like domain-containing protein [Halomarina rubra]|uniref:Immunoglobulin-like domain-containing protein n=1 Tax=Halomarina rubra TaxID=2071873 RepID=A0ABD6AS24_9EURY|nr:hypothetical protein [Halomarina rubra]